MEIKKNKLKLIETFWMMLSLTFFLMFTANAGSLVSDQDEANRLVLESDRSNTLEPTIFPTDNNNITINNITIIYDYGLFTSLNDNLYFKIDNTVIGTLINISAEWGRTDSVLDTYQINMTEIGTYTFLLNPERSDEYLKLYIDYPEDMSAFAETFHFTRNEDVSTVNTIFSPLIDGAVELVEINVNIWRIVYYLFITFIVLFVIAGVFWSALKLFQFSRNLDNKRESWFRRK